MLDGHRTDYVLRLAGPVRLVRRDGTDLTPNAAKARGMLALIGTSANHRRPRSWLQDKLWSDRQPEQGAQSMRQALSMMRRELGSDGDCLIVEKGWVGLDPNRVAVALEAGPEDLGFGGEIPEFCEGLDIVDPEFEDWIRDQRAAFAEAAEAMLESNQAGLASRGGAGVARAVDLPESREPRLHVAAPEAGDGALMTLADLLSTRVAAQVSRMGGIEVTLAPQTPSEGRDGDTLHVQIKAFRFGEGAMLHARLVDPRSDTLLWSGDRAAALDFAQIDRPGEMASLVAETAAACVLELGRGGTGETAHGLRAGYRALRGVLTTDRDRLLDCDRVLDGLDDLPGLAARQAWRAHLRLVSVIERHVADTVDYRDEAIELAAKAREADPLNPIVSALTADVALHLEERPEKALGLALGAVAQDRFSPFTYCSLAQSLARMGKAADAHEAALSALTLAVGQPNPEWWNMRCCVTAVQLGDYEQALTFAKTAHELAPGFKPPLRFLAALHYQKRDYEKAVGALQALKRLEPDFTLDLMASETYPLATLRNTPLIRVAESALV